jgi:uncharacterized membrane protein
VYTNLFVNQIYLSNPKLTIQNFNMDELVNKLAGMGVAGLVLVGLVATSSYAGAVAITTSLALLGGLFGMLGGVVVLTLIASVSSMIAKVGVETFAKAVVKKLMDNGVSASSIIQEISGFPMITEGLKAQLREYVRQA